MNEYVITHAHTQETNGVIVEVPSSLKDYLEEIKKKDGIKGLIVTNHGNKLGWFKHYQLMKKYGHKYVHAVEGYACLNGDDKFNKHILLYSTNYNGFEEINELISTSYQRDGHFYKRPRMFIDEILKCENIIISTACSGGIFAEPKEEDKINSDIVKSKILEWGLENKDRLFLEIQPHIYNKQILVNNEVLKLHKQGYNIICSNDVHYTNNEFKEIRKIISMDKNSGEEFELVFDLSIKSYEEQLKGFVNLGIDKSIVEEALTNTVKLYDMCEEYEIDCSTKYPNLYDNPKESLMEMAIEKLYKLDYITNDDISKYLNRITTEMDTIEHLNALSYINLFSDWLTWCRERGIAIGFGRGCFTADAIIHTKKEMKTIDKIEIGDEVITENGEWKKVLNTFKYDINESMIEFEYQIQGSSYKKYKNICTLDHKILTSDGWKESKDLKVGDLLCSPKLNNFKDEKIIIDLLKYNKNCYDYDDNFIYEVLNTNKNYKGSPNDLVRNNIIPNKTFAERLIRVGGSGSKVAPDRIKRILEYTGLDSLEDYIKYCKKNGKTINKLNRYLVLDKKINTFISMMYGDGFTSRNSSVALAINNTTKKDINLEIMKYFCNKIGYGEDRIYYNYASNGRNLIQCYINSGIIYNLFTDEFFKSEFKKDKIFNTKLLNQNKECILGLYEGFVISDGSISGNKLSFDSTSKSLISAFKTINNMLGYEPMALDVRLAHVCNRGYNNKESYKVRKAINREKRVIKNDDKYWYLPITKILKHDNYSGYVYDMEIESTHSYTINNIIVHNSASSSEINYLTNITGVDSIVWDTNFDRFMNKAKRANPDIDVDIEPDRRQEARSWFFNHPKLNCSDILTFGTVAYKGACDTIIRTSELTKQQGEQLKEMYADIRTEFELSDSDLFREKLPISIDELAKRMGDYGDLIKKVILLEGCTVSIGSHPAGVLVTDLDIRKKIGVITMEDKETGDYKLVSQCDMKELDYMGYVKADALGLSTVGAINKTVKYLGQEFPEPQHFDFHDEKVWEDIKKSPCMIFQFEETKAHDYMKVALDLVDIDKKLYTMSMMSGLIRPSGKTVRDSFLRGEKGGNGHIEVDNMFPNTSGKIVYQEDITKFLVEFCGYDYQQSDIVRKSISKKQSDDVFMPMMKKIELDFMNYFPKHYKATDEEVQNVLKSFLDIVKSSQMYGFCYSHAIAYTMYGYIGAYYRYYNTIEYCTANLNEFNGKPDKLKEIYHFINNFTEIKIINPIYPVCKLDYTYDKESNIIYEGMLGAKGVGKNVEIAFNSVDNNIKFNSIKEFIIYIKENEIKVNKRELITLNIMKFFREFGSQNKNEKTILAMFGEKTIHPSRFKYDKKATEKTKTKKLSDLDLLLETIPDTDFNPLLQAFYDLEVFGHTPERFENMNEVYYVIDCTKPYSKYIIDLYNVGTGEKVTYKGKDIKKPVKQNLIQILNRELKPDYYVCGEHSDGKPKFLTTGTKSWNVTEYKYIDPDNGNIIEKPKKELDKE